MKSLFVLTSFLLLTFSCKSDKFIPAYTGSGDIEIRLWNNTSYIMTDIFVNTSGGENTYESLDNKEKSTYRRFEKAYRYAFISFKIKDKPYAIQPVDYVGEQLLEKGKYTYKVTVTDLDAGTANLEFIVD